MPGDVSVERDVREWALAEASPAEVTLCVRGMRCDSGSTTAAFKAFMDSTELCGKYDFLHVPMDFRSKKCFGYSFVNFVNSDAARRFVRAVAAGTFSHFAAGHGLMRAIPSRKQGLAECLVSWLRGHSRSVRSAEVFPFVRPLHPTMPINPYLEIEMQPSRGGGELRTSRVTPSGPRGGDIPMPAFARCPRVASGVSRSEEERVHWRVVAVPSCTFAAKGPVVQGLISL